MSVEEVDLIASRITNFVDNGLESFELPIISQPVVSDLISPLVDELTQLLDNIQKPEEYGDNADEDEATKDKIAKFNESAAQQTKNFALKMALTRVTDTLTNKLRAEDETAEKSVIFQSIPSTQLQYDVLNSYLMLLDILIALSQKELFPSARNDFYLILQLMLESLMSFLSEILEEFWYALESRQLAISTFIFDQKITLNRIAMLGICNTITDRLYKREKLGKYDSYQKDSFNDNLHARVRTFLSSLLLFDDLTGLNKYFAIANRVNREPNLGKAKNGDEELLQDILQFHRLLRDPYYYLKNSHSLSRQADSMNRLYKYLLDEEAKYAKKHPVPDIYKVKQPLLEDKKAKLMEKNERAVFFPEHYWLAPFEDVQRGAEFDALKSEDMRITLNRFDSSRYRRLLLIQMYLVSSFFLDLQISKKRDTLRRIGAPANTKHVTDENTPESLGKIFASIKREIPKLCRTWDTQLLFLLQHVSQSEEYWVEWLIYGKNAQGKPLLNVLPITEDEIHSTLEKLEKVAPYKTKRYFNSHATPQLSRKMRQKTGISLLLETLEADDDYEAKISELTERIGSETDESVNHELKEERSLLLWRMAKTLRGKQWLKVSEVVDVDILGVEAPEEVKVESASVTTNVELLAETEDVEMEDVEANNGVSEEKSAGEEQDTETEVVANAESVAETPVFSATESPVPEETKSELPEEPRLEVERPVPQTTEKETTEKESTENETTEKEITPDISEAIVESRKRGRSPDEDEDEETLKKPKLT